MIQIESYRYSAKRKILYNNKNKPLCISTALNILKKKEREYSSALDPLRTILHEGANILPQFKDIGIDEETRDDFPEYSETIYKYLLLKNELPYLIKKKKERDKKIRFTKTKKREYDAENIEPFLEKIRIKLIDKLRKVKKYNTYIEKYPNVLISDYYRYTTVNFEPIYSDIDINILKEKWDKLLSIKKMKVHKSSLSDSLYAIDYTNGYIYRLSDHWGRVASCLWFLGNNKIIDNDMKAIARANIKDFKRLNDGYIYNDRYDSLYDRVINKYIDLLKGYLRNECPDKNFKRQTKKEIKRYIRIFKYWKKYNIR